MLKWFLCTGAAAWYNQVSTRLAPVVPWSLSKYHNCPSLIRNKHCNIGSYIKCKVLLYFKSKLVHLLVGNLSWGEMQARGGNPRQKCNKNKKRKADMHCTPRLQCPLESNLLFYNILTIWIWKYTCSADPKLAFKRHDIRIYVALEHGIMSSEYSITRNYFGPAERVQLVTCRLTSDYPAKEYHH